MGFFLLLWDPFNGFLVHQSCSVDALDGHRQTQQMVQACSILKGTGEAHTQGHRPPSDLNAAAATCWMFYDAARLLKLLWDMNQKLLDVRQLQPPRWWMSPFWDTPVEKVDPWKLLGWNIALVRDFLLLQMGGGRIQDTAGAKAERKEKGAEHVWSRSFVTVVKSWNLKLGVQNKSDRTWRLALFVLLSSA